MHMGLAPWAAEIRVRPPNANSQTAQDSTSVFALAVLLSSLFVFNQMGGIDEAALDRLSLVTRVARLIRVRAASSKGEALPCV